MKKRLKCIYNGDTGEMGRKIRKHYLIREDVERPEQAVFNRLRQVKESDYITGIIGAEAWAEGDNVVCGLSNTTAILYRYGEPSPGFTQSQLAERIRFLKECGIFPDTTLEALSWFESENNPDNMVDTPRNPTHNKSAPS